MTIVSEARGDELADSLLEEVQAVLTRHPPRAQGDDGPVLGGISGEPRRTMMDRVSALRARRWVKARSFGATAAHLDPVARAAALSRPLGRVNPVEPAFIS
jgi:hypothetical protein